LDSTGVHPESYHVVEKMAGELGVKIEELIGKTELLNSIDIRKYVSPETGEHTLKDIVAELRNPDLIREVRRNNLSLRRSSKWKM
jgi:uncharacterized protein